MSRHVRLLMTSHTEPQSAIRGSTNTNTATTIDDRERARPVAPDGGVQPWREAFGHARSVAGGGRSASVANLYGMERAVSDPLAVSSRIGRDIVWTVAGAFAVLLVLRFLSPVILPVSSPSSSHRCWRRSQTRLERRA